MIRIVNYIEWTAFVAVSVIPVYRHYTIEEDVRVYMDGHYTSFDVRTRL